MCRFVLLIAIIALTLYINVWAQQQTPESAVNHF